MASHCGRELPCELKWRSAAAPRLVADPRRRATPRRFVFIAEERPTEEELAEQDGILLRSHMLSGCTWAPCIWLGARSATQPGTSLRSPLGALVSPARFARHLSPARFARHQSSDCFEVQVWSRSSSSG